MEGFRGKRILIAGLGKSGTAALDALVNAGASIAVIDDRDIEKDEPLLFARLKAAGVDCYLCGVQAPDECFDYVVMSPGVPPSASFASKAAQRGAEVIGELELAWRLGRGRYIAITGTNGKTTTTTLVGEIIRAAGRKTVVAGNIGIPIVSKSVSADDDTWLVTEVSSFQLETIKAFRPKIAVLLNLTPDHMDRHKTMDNYAAAKARVFENQEACDTLVYNADDDLVSSLARGARSNKIAFSRKKELGLGAFVRDGKIVFAGADGSLAEVISADDLRIPGAHNLENALAAVAVAYAAGIAKAVTADTLRSFMGVEHRLEFVSEIGGVRFVNDSKGTNPDAGIKAIEAVGKDILLIAGGYDKDADFTEYIESAKGRVKKLFLLGTTAGKIQSCAVKEGYKAEDALMAGNMAEAVALAAERAKPGDTVLLSPACASWDMYLNYEERGADFKARVAALKEGK